jgi:hypothetical protein
MVILNEVPTLSVGTKRTYLQRRKQAPLPKAALTDDRQCSQILRPR